MSKSKNTQNSKKSELKDIIVSIVLIILIIVFAVVILILRMKPQNKTVHGDRKINIRTGEVLTEIIDYSNSNVKLADNNLIPGFETLNLKSDTKEQEVFLSNPEENTCYFQMSLVLENGEQIWKSELLEPGYAFDRIEINDNLKKGTYENVRLKYDCFFVKGKNLVNSAEIKIKLQVD